MPLPNSLPWMESVDAKMIRAHEHLEAFSREVDEYLSTIKLHMYLKTGAGWPNPLLVMHASDYIPPIRLSAIAGDCIHNMRSALDNLVCGLALTVDRACDCKATKFPFTQAESEWPSAAQNCLPGVPRGARRTIKSVQPWCEALKPHPLMILNKLSNMDKHRFCAFALAHNENAGFRVHCIDGSSVDFWPTTRLYLGEVQTFTVPVPSSLLGSSARVEATGTFVLSFRDEGPWGELHVTEVLDRCFHYIETKVISSLKPFFEPKP